MVGQFQSAFVPGRLKTDNALMAFDTFHFMRKKTRGKNGLIGLKLDISKAYDGIERSFSKEELQSMSFPNN